MSDWTVQDLLIPPDTAPDGELRLAAPNVGQAFVAPAFVQGLVPGVAGFVGPGVAGFAGRPEVLQGAFLPTSHPRLTVSARDGRVVVVSCDDAALLHRAHAAFDPLLNAVVLDGRQPERGAAHLRTPEGEELFVVENGTVRWYRLATLRPAPADPEVPPLDLRPALAGVPDWLREDMERRTRSTSLLGRAIAAGAWGRWWTPLDPADAVKRLLAGQESPIELASAWALSLPDAARDHLVHAGRVEVEAAFATLEALREAAVLGDADAVRAEWSELVEQREALACVSWVLLRGGDLRLEHALHALDALAEARASERPRAEPTVPWQAVVHVGEPTAWWAA